MVTYTYPFAWMWQHDMALWWVKTMLWDFYSISTQIAKTLGSTSVRYGPNTKVSDHCLIDVDLMLFATWVVAWCWTYYKPVIMYSHVPNSRTYRNKWTRGRNCRKSNSRTLCFTLYLLQQIIEHLGFFSSSLIVKRVWLLGTPALCCMNYYLVMMSHHFFYRWTINL